MNSSRISWDNQTDYRKLLTGRRRSVACRARRYDLAIRMAQNRTMISGLVTTRQAHGEHTYWAAVALASLLGQIGLRGGGIGFGYTAEHCIGNDFDSIPAAAAAGRG